MSTKSIWFFTAVDSLDLDFFPVKGETPECSPTLSLKCRHALPQQVALHLPHENF